MAKKLREEEWTLAKLQIQRPEKLLELGLNESVVLKILGQGRPPIPSDVLIKTLYDNRWVCCVCRDAERPVVVHHIKSWAESRDHSSANLAVLCSIHHGEAHSTHALELTLTADRLKAMKIAWEQSVSREDQLAIFKSTQLMSCQWWYFNHLRVFEIAEHVGVEITQLKGFQAALSNGACDGEGYLCPTEGLLYVGQARSLSLYRYMSSMLKAAIGHALVRNISDELDRGTLDILVTPGDLVFVQGSYHFTDIPDGSGADMVRGRRSVNKVEITFVFDRNEGTSGSARTEWLLGVRSLGCLLRANKLKRDLKGILHIEATVLAIRSAHEELKTRMYEIGLYQSGLIGDEVEDEELEAFDPAYDEDDSLSDGSLYS
ncbi:HNH endonuclease signature motif containing protein [Pseudomonas putida]|uniref:HNH endonuclease signature motif containing protein n=1 Tax=Pseudomonas putida TaxID=303 RepID=UPI001110D999|nr:HNH endonuclease signature motif containing protein [Pseudomonas putida]